MTIRLVFQIRYGAKRKSIRRDNLIDWLLVVFVTVGQVGFPLIFVCSPWLDAANYQVPSAANLLGVPFLLGGLWLFWRSHADLGNSWSVSLKLNRRHRLITQGVYRVLRHPMYASFFLIAISQVLLLGNWLAGWAGLVAVGLLYVIRMPQEEKMMLEHFGEEYSSYRQSTGGLFPRLRAPHPDPPTDG